jgi:microcystin-dependent protein
MADPFVGEIQAFPFPWAVNGFNQCWLPCFGQMLPVQQFSPLFSLIGTAFGGNGSTTFALPNLSGSVAISQGTGPGLSPRVIGSTLGSPSVTLSSDEMARHTHGLRLGDKSTQRGTAGPGTAGTLAAIDPNFSGFIVPKDNTDTTLSPNAMTLTGGSLPHNNLQPTLVLVWCIATVGIFPSFS